MFDDDHLSVYAYALMLCAALFGGALYVARPDFRPALIALEDEADGRIETASIPLTAEDVGADDWNNPVIPWKTYEQGMREMARTNKPAVLVLQAEWCLVCQDYQQIFADKLVEGYADEFVFILADVEKQPELQRRYDVDGDYIPRTFLLEPNGDLMHQATGGYDRQRFFVNPYDAQELGGLLARSAPPAQVELAPAR